MELLHKNQALTSYASSCGGSVKLSIAQLQAKAVEASTAKGAATNYGTSGRPVLVV